MAQSTVIHQPDARKVFVVHGRDERLRRDFFTFLRSLGLAPIEWSEAVQMTGKGSPYIGEVLDVAFSAAQAVIVLLTPDDEVRLLPELSTPTDPPEEREYRFQPRPNVLFEAGTAFGRCPERTVLIEIGDLKRFSDVAGRHAVRLTNDASTRHEVANRLRTAGCLVSTVGTDWLGEGNFSAVRRSGAGNPEKDKKDDVWSTQKPSSWSPLREAARELKSRFVELSRVYRRQWTDVFTPESLSGDFCELYMLSPDPIQNVYDCDPNRPRMDENAVQKVRMRMGHELNYAVSSLYITAKYLGWAEHVRRALQEEQWLLRGDARDEVLRLLSNIRGSLQGDAGILVEQQDSIAEMVWDPAGRVITIVEFRKQLLELPGWEQFINLFRFFIHFQYKIEYEVANTISALRELKNTVDQLFVEERG